MKIFIAVHHYPPRFTGGAELRAHRTGRALQECGHQGQAFAIEQITDVPQKVSFGKMMFMKGFRCAASASMQPKRQIGSCFPIITLGLEDTLKNY